MKFLPSNVHIIGYARSKIELGDFRKRITSKIKIRNDEDTILIKAFVELCTYQSGSYDEQVGYQTLHRICEAIENGFSLKDRIFYMALPPSVFAAASHGLKNNVYSTNGTNRIIVEKPFGKDSDSSRQLSVTLAASWAEEEIYRIDHYLGKEMVKNLMVLR
jgi:glucose-6-phosphate 1-dehydrogenase